MSQPGNMARIFLENLNSRGTKNTFIFLQKLVEELEEKSDPEMTEVRLVSSIYEFFEKFKLLEGNLKSYVKEFSSRSATAKLSDLYDSIGLDGSIYRD